MDGQVASFFIFFFFFLSSDLKTILLSAYIVISVFKFWIFYIDLVGRCRVRSQLLGHCVYHFVFKKFLRFLQWIWLDFVVFDACLRVWFLNVVLVKVHLVVMDLRSNWHFTKIMVIVIISLFSFFLLIWIWFHLF